MATQLVRVSHGIWRPAVTANDADSRTTALLAACPAGTVIAGLTAARLHGLWLPDFRRGPSSAPEPVEVIVHRDIARPSARSHSRRPELLARRQILRPDEIVDIDGMLVTSVERTWRDLAPRLTLFDLVAAGDSALRGGSTTVETLAEAVRRAARGRGAVAARDAFALLDARSRSRPESHMRCIIVTAGLPRPDVNVPIHSSSGEWLAEPDLSYDDVLLAMEYDGADHAKVGRVRRNIDRGVDLEVRGGWRTITFGPSQVFLRPDQIVIAVTRLRAERRTRGRT